MKAGGDRATMATKKPGKLSSGTPWEKLEFFPTPPWATRALFEMVMMFPKRVNLWDPCAGMGHMLSVLREYRPCAKGSDIYAYPDAVPGIEIKDFLDPETVWPFSESGWIVTNPPFNPAADMLEKALALDGVDGVAFLQRLQWLTGVDRYERIYSRRPPFIFAPFVERVPMCLGGYDPNGSTATDYAWFVWIKNKETVAHTLHIPPCKMKFTFDRDRQLAALHVPGWTAPSRLKKSAPDQGFFPVP